MQLPEHHGVELAGHLLGEDFVISRVKDPAAFQQPDVHGAFPVDPLEHARVVALPRDPKRYRGEIDEAAVEKRPVLEQLDRNLPGGVPPYPPRLELVAVHREDEAQPRLVQGDQFRVDQEVLFAVGDEQVIETVGLQQLGEAGCLGPETVEPLARAGKRLGLQEHRVVVDQVPQADQDGLVLEVDIVQPVYQVAPADPLAGAGFLRDGRDDLKCL